MKRKRQFSEQGRDILQTERQILVNQDIIVLFLKNKPKQSEGVLNVLRIMIVNL